MAERQSRQCTAQQLPALKFTDAQTMAERYGCRSGIIQMGLMPDGCPTKCRYRTPMGTLSRATMRRR